MELFWVWMEGQCDDDGSFLPPFPSISLTLIDRLYNNQGHLQTIIVFLKMITMMIMMMVMVIIIFILIFDCQYISRVIAMC